MSGKLVWFKSSYSNSKGGACVDVAYAWCKSSYSNSGAGQCVEVAAHPRTVHVRDSKDIHGPELGLAPRAWSAFVAYAAEQALA
ncbi:DUF397 domain-containing protein [Streptomyces sp. NPDC055078]